PPGTALSAAARSVAALALDTLFSSGRTGWAPPGPGVLALPLGDDTVPALAVEVSLEADAVSALARTPPPIAPAASNPTTAAHRFLRPPALAALYMACSPSCRGRQPWRPWRQRARPTCPLVPAGLCLAY